jgi:peptide/nickel transport system substrate-binding protein
MSRLSACPEQRARGCAVPFLIAALFVGLSATPSVAAERIFSELIGSPPVSLDPAKSNHIQDDQVMWPLYDALTQLSADGTQMLPALAERWEASADGLSYTFVLRRNVQFHDGSLLDAEAVKASYERQYLPSSPYYSSSPPNAYEKVLSGLIKEVRIVDTHTVAITTNYSRPQQFALVKIVSPTALRQHKGDLSRAPVGTGPFRLERWEGSQIALAPFARSWHGRPKLDGVQFVAQAIDEKAIGRLIAGEFDLLVNVPPDFFELVRADPRTDLVKFGGLNTMFLGMRLDRPALKDRRIREAVVRAVNRERLATVLGRGAMIAARGPLPPGCAAFDPEISQSAFDPDLARTLLKEAGKTSGLRLRLLYFNPIALWSEVALTIKGDLEKVGITLDLLRVPSWKDFHQERAKGDHDLYLYSWSISTPDPERLLFPLFQSQSQDNFGHLMNARIDKLLAEARQPMEEARRLRLYGEVARLVVEEVPALFLVHRIGLAAVGSRVKGLTLNLYGEPQDKLAKVQIP